MEANAGALARADAGVELGGEETAVHDRAQRRRHRHDAPVGAKVLGAPDDGDHCRRETEDGTVAGADRGGYEPEERRRAVDRARGDEGEPKEHDDCEEEEDVHAAACGAAATGLDGDRGEVDCRRGRREVVADRAGEEAGEG